MKNESTALSRLWKINHHKVTQADTDLDIIFLVFHCSSCMWLFRIQSSHLCSEYGTPSQSSPKMCAIIFSPSSYLCSSCPTQFSFLFIILCTSTALLLALLSANNSQRSTCSWYISIFNLSDCCYPDLDVGTPHSPSHSFLPWYRGSLSVSLTALNPFCIYVLPFQLSSSWP